MKWVALFSQSGSELVEITRELGRSPDYTYTTNLDRNTWCEGVNELPDVCAVESDKINIILRMNDEPLLITMHGYLRILPADICNTHNVFNGHPGDIIKYPELKGKDPQRKAYDLRLGSTGVVLHRATEELDGGDIYRFKRVDIHPDYNFNDLCLMLKQVSIDLWVDLMTDLLYTIDTVEGED